MKSRTFITHESALEFWRLSNVGQTVEPKHTKARPMPSDIPNASTTTEIMRDWLGLHRPYHISVGAEASRRDSKDVMCHVISTDLPRDAFYPLGKNVYVSSPEFCFVQMGAPSTLVELIKIGFEFCGKYRLNNKKEEFGKQVRLSNKTKLKHFVEKLHSIDGITNARRASQYIIDGSGSPMKTAVAMLLTLPVKLGGYGLTSPQMSYTVDTASRLDRTESSSTYVCDMMWTDANVALECDENDSTAAECELKRSRQQTLLSNAGVSVINVTREQLLDEQSMNNIARLIAKCTKKRMPASALEQNPQRDELRYYLLKLSS